MADMKWTREQEDAIFTSDCNLLVAAGAGSGKTAVLVQRIINKIINQGVDIDRLLIVTFTNAAASEMRERISDSLYKNLETKPELRKQVSLLSKASIMTIHSFCLKVIRDNFFKADIDPNFRMGDETEVKLLGLEVLDELLEEKYDSNDKEFENLVNIYVGSKGDAEFKNLVLSIYRFIQSMPAPETWLREKYEMYNLVDCDDFARTIWGKDIIDFAKNEVNGVLEDLKVTYDELIGYENTDKYLLTLQDDIQMLKTIPFEKDWDTIYKAIVGLNFARTPSITKVDEESRNLIKEARDKMKASIKSELQEDIFISTSKEIIDDLKISYNILKSLSNLVIEYGNKFKQKKREKNIIDFNDIEHLALDILVNNPDIARIYKEKYNEILIDEYQDSNIIQETILNSISNNRTFMVGDVKQSIYRFRKARPELFLNKYETYKLHKGDSESKNQKILLFKNFRSAKSVIDSVNYIFKSLMSKNIGEIDYDEDEYLQLGSTDYESNFQNTELDIIENKLSDEFEEIEDKPQIEGKFIANRINELVGKVDVYDKKLKSVRKAMYKDIVILLRSPKTFIDSFIQELSKLDIPVYADNDGGYFNSMEVQIIVALLSIVDNPFQDIPLLTVLRSQIGNFSIDELIEIRLASKNCSFYEALQLSANGNLALEQKIKDFLEFLNELREKSKHYSIAELLRYIYNITSYYYYVSLLPDGAKRQANLKLLIDKAREYEKTSYHGLFNFLHFVDNLKNNNEDISSSKIIGENENVVRIMTIHKSKGLEFPIVFLSGTGKKFNMRDLSEPIILHPELGFGVDIIDPEKMIKYPTTPKYSIENKIRAESLSEEMRILYVAMTRAKEKLIITGMVPNVDKFLNSCSRKVNKFLIADSKNLIEWIGKATIDKDCGWDINSYTVSDVCANESDESYKNGYERLIKNVDMMARDKEFEKVINNNFLWKYPYEFSTTLPTKITITEIKRMNDSLYRNENIESIIEKPEFMRDDNLSGTEYGTFIHNALQQIDFSNPEPAKIIDKLLPENKKSMRNRMIRQLIDFQNTDFFSRVKNAERVFKETTFNLNLPVSEVFDTTSNDFIMLQGIIDLYFIEDGEVVLVDYKTDKVENENELIEKYLVQLKYYKRALEEITGQKVKETYIYSCNLNKEIKMPIKFK